jgi:hypothetical protein
MFKFAVEKSLKAHGHHAEKGSVLPLNVALWENGPWQPALSIALANARYSAGPSGVCGTAI